MCSRPPKVRPPGPPSPPGSTPTKRKSPVGAPNKKKKGTPAPLYKKCAVRELNKQNKKCAVRESNPGQLRTPEPKFEHERVSLLWEAAIIPLDQRRLLFRRSTRKSRTQDPPSRGAVFNERQLLPQPEFPGFSPVLACRGTETASLLLRAGAKTEICDSDGRTALVIACQKGLDRVAKTLLEAGAN